MRKSGCLRNLNDIKLKNLKNKRVLLRADFNVPIGDDGTIDGQEDWRIKAVFPTIKYLLKQKAKIILLAHLGRPKISRKFIKSLRLKVSKAESSEYSLRPVAKRMNELLKKKIKFVNDCLGKSAKKAVEEMKPGEIILLENLRFYKEEAENNVDFAKKLAELGDIYINDAFSDCHRAHASIVGIAKFLPSCAGLLLEKELKLMESAVKPKHPAIAIIGGAKIETKLPAVNNLAKIYDFVLVGGMIANEIIESCGKYKFGLNVILPEQAGILRKNSYDIGLISAQKFAACIKKAKSIVWNGPMGKFEEEKYSAGTRGMISAIKIALKNGARVLIGGGETISAVQKFAPELMNKKIANLNISTGGGAMLEFLAGKNLPGIEALKK